jgi:putative nucleotidyltransferase with HDIG domain
VPDAIGPGKLAEGDARRFVRGIDNLPTLPSVVARVSEIIDSPNASAADINKVIRQDIALSARILRLVNSSFYGFPRRISSITHAVVILGFNTVRNVALSAFVLDAFNAKDLPFGHREFWIHSLGVGVSANAMARLRGSADAEDAFIAGLLHDVGKIVLHQHARTQFAAALMEVKEKDCLLVDAERDVLGLTHAQVGSMLLDAWHLPPRIVEAVERHHAPETSTEARELTAIVHVADILTRALLVGNGGDRRVPLVSHQAWSTLKLDLTQVSGLLKDIARDIRKVDAFAELL